MSAVEFHRARVERYSTLRDDDRYLRLDGEQGRWAIISFEELKSSLRDEDRQALADKLTED
jgi:hypothetical protein